LTERDGARARRWIWDDDSGSGEICAGASFVNPFEEIGGESGVRSLVDRFYQRMDSRPDAAAIRAMHKADLGKMRERLSLFLSGWLGGPPDYFERLGPVCMRSAHDPFPIDEAARDAWVACMTDALVEADLAEPTRAALVGAFTRMAEMLRNLPGAEEADPSCAPDRPTAFAGEAERGDPIRPQ